MKKIIVLTLGLILTASFILTGCSQETTELEEVKVSEVVHSIFYAPHYVALEKGFFEEEGLKVEMSVGQGADKSMAALLSGSADIALLGTEAGIYVYNEGKENHPVSFAQLTQRAGNFLISRTDDKSFEWEDVKGKTIIGGRVGGMPQMTLEYILKQNNIDPVKDVEIINNVSFESTAGAFSADVGDYTVEFEPSATALENSGKGYVVASLGLDSGKIPYTVYMSTKEYINENPETIQKFTNAIYKSQLWIKEHSAKEIAEVIAPQFEGTDIADLEKIVDRYKGQESWKYNPIFEEESLILIQDIMESAGLLDKRVPYEELINTEFAEKAVE